MKPLPLTPQEVKRALEDGKVILVRPMEPQPKINKLGNLATWAFAGVTGSNALDKLIEYINDVIETVGPFGKAGTEFFGQEEWNHFDSPDRGTKYFYKADDESKLKYWLPSCEMSQWASRLTLIHTGTEVKQVDGIWKWFGSMEVINGKA